MPETETQTTRNTIDRLMGAIYSPMAMLAGLQLEVFTPLRDGPMDAASLAAKLDVRAEKLSPLLYALVVAELLTVEDGVFANTPESAQFLAKGAPGYMGGVHELLSDIWGATFQTAETVRKGSPQAKHDFDAMSVEALRAFLRGLHGAAMGTGRYLAELLSLSRYRHLADVGGGSGGLAMGACQACEGLRSTVVELPKTATITAEFIADADMAERVTISPADVTEEIPGRFDIAVLRALIQVLSAEQAQRVISNVGEALESGGTIAILGRMVDDSRTTPVRDVAFNLVFLNVYDDGRCYTESEHRQWLDQAGFTEFKRQTLPDGTQMITAQKG
jgi:hypothetical protein|tara:strand:- start:1302 stop:2300 length:999 start_codon:yes stop_codon:yes gene_type:complete